MTLLAPALLAFLGLIPLIILLYLIRAHRRREPVSSVLLWRNLAQDLEMRTRLRRPPLTVLLLLQLLIVLVGTLALARPFWERTTPPSRLLVLVVDASASMNATDGAPSRLAEAKARARERAASAGPETMIAVIRAGPRASLEVMTRESGAAQAAIEAIPPSDGAADLRTAWLLAGAIAASWPAATASVVLFSDGAFSGPLPAIPASSSVVLVGSSGENQAIVQIGVRRPLGGAARSAVFVRVANFASRPVERTVRAVGDGLLVREQVVRLGARGTVDLIFDPPVGTRVFSVQLLGSDLLAADDRAEVVIAQPGEYEALLVSAAPELMRRALRALPQLTLRERAPDQYSGPGNAAIVVFDGYLPPALPATPVLIVNPPVGSWLAEARFSSPSFAVGVDPASAIVAGVDLGPAEFGRVAQLTVPPWAAPVVRGMDGPLILEGEREGRRVVILGFDPAASNLPKLVAFPALIANAVDWLLSAPAESVEPGTAVRLPSGLQGDLVGPDGRRQPAADLALTDATERAGLYQLRRLGADPLALFAVNVASESESDIAPRQVSVEPPLPSAALPVGRLSEEGIEFWPYLVAGVLFLLLVEWALYLRRRAT
ncbi:MAG: VWA domain-containing protein [Chloroflexota bacterium]|nr:VWA domain-containing protein [Dehalococcoidia bacterium]MDW8254074.1 VWA domain-containing protein [Chloroflexota bacterium]